MGSTTSKDGGGSPQKPINQLNQTRWKPPFSPSTSSSTFIPVAVGSARTASILVPTTGSRATSGSSSLRVVSSSAPPGSTSLSNPLQSSSSFSSPPIRAQAGVSVSVSLPVPTISPHHPLDSSGPRFESSTSVHSFHSYTRGSSPSPPSPAQRLCGHPPSPQFLGVVSIPGAILPLPTTPTAMSDTSSAAGPPSPFVCWKPSLRTLATAEQPRLDRPLSNSDRDEHHLVQPSPLVLESPKCNDPKLLTTTLPSITHSSADDHNEEDSLTQVQDGDANSVVFLRAATTPVETLEPTPSSLRHHQHHHAHSTGRPAPSLPHHKAHRAKSLIFRYKLHGGAAKNKSNGCSVAVH